MIRVGITGQSGFVGTHLFNAFSQNSEFKCIPFEDEYFTNDEKLRNFVRSCDVIFHLAALVRIQIWGVKVEIGDNTFIGNETRITGTSDTIIKIGRNCDISDRVNIFTGTHHLGSIEQAAGTG